MGDGGILVAIDAAAREATLFAAIFFLIGGVDDLLVDLIYALRRTGMALGRWVGAPGGGAAVAAAPVVPIGGLIAAGGE